MKQVKDNDYADLVLRWNDWSFHLSPHPIEMWSPWFWNASVQLVAFLEYLEDWNWGLPQAEWESIKNCCNDPSVGRSCASVDNCPTESQTRCWKVVLRLPRAISEDTDPNTILKFLDVSPWTVVRAKVDQVLNSIRDKLGIETGKDESAGGSLLAGEAGSQRTDDRWRHLKCGVVLPNSQVLLEGDTPEAEDFTQQIIVTSLANARDAYNPESSGKNNFNPDAGLVQEKIAKAFMSIQSRLYDIRSKKDYEWRHELQSELRSANDTQQILRENRNALDAQETQRIREITAPNLQRRQEASSSAGEAHMANKKDDFSAPQQQRALVTEGGEVRAESNPNAQEQSSHQGDPGERERMELPHEKEQISSVQRAEREQSAKQLSEKTQELAKLQIDFSVLQDHTEKLKREFEEEMSRGEEKLNITTEELRGSQELELQLQRELHDQAQLQAAAEPPPAQPSWFQQLFSYLMPASAGAVVGFGSTTLVQNEFGEDHAVTQPNLRSALAFRAMLVEKWKELATSRGAFLREVLTGLRGAGLLNSSESKAATPIIDKKDPHDPFASTELDEKLFGLVRYAIQNVTFVQVVLQTWTTRNPKPLVAKFLYASTHSNDDQQTDAGLITNSRRVLQECSDALNKDDPVPVWGMLLRLSQVIIDKMTQQCPSPGCGRCDALFTTNQELKTGTTILDWVIIALALIAVGIAVGIFILWRRGANAMQADNAGAEAAGDHTASPGASQHCPQDTTPMPDYHSDRATSLEAVARLDVDGQNAQNSRNSIFPRANSAHRVPTIISRPATSNDAPTNAASTVFTYPPSSEELSQERGSEPRNVHPPCSECDVSGDATLFSEDPGSTSRPPCHPANSTAPTPLLRAPQSDSTAVLLREPSERTVPLLRAPQSDSTAVLLREPSESAVPLLRAPQSDSTVVLLREQSESARALPFEV